MSFSRIGKVWKVSSFIITLIPPPYFYRGFLDGVANICSTSSSHCSNVNFCFSSLSIPPRRCTRARRAHDEWAHVHLVGMPLALGGPGGHRGHAALQTPSLPIRYIKYGSCLQTTYGIFHV